MKYLFTDIRAALRTMGFYMTVTLISLAKVIAAMLAVGVVLACSGYAIMNWPLQSMAVIVIFILGGWFYIELDNARAVRLEEELEQQNAEIIHGDRL